MKKYILVISIFFAFIISCDRHPLYLLEDSKVILNVTVDGEIDSLWDKKWRNYLKYDWYENKYGKIGYTTPEKIECTFLADSNIIYRQDVRIKKQTIIPIPIDKIYDLVLYNRTSTTYIEYISNESSSF